MPQKRRPRTFNPWLNGVVIFVSLMGCTGLLLTRIPGAALLGFGPQWLLMWLVAWSIKRNVSLAVIVAIAVGLLHDSLMVTALPSHVPGYMLVAWLTASWRQQRYLQEDLVSVAFIVFVMAFISETVMALQHLLLGLRSFANLWLDYQQIALTSAFLSSLFSILICTPLVRWWNQFRTLDRQ